MTTTRAARLAEIRAALDSGAYVGTSFAAIAVARELLAEVERLRGALEEIAESRDAGRHDGLPEPYPAHSDYEMWGMARAALEDPR